MSFKVRLEKGNRVQVPKPLRMRYSLDNSKVLKVSVRVIEAHTDWEDFHARMDKSGRITISKLTLCLLQSEASKLSLAGEIVEVSIEPA